MFKLQKGYDEYVTKTFRLPKEFVEQLEKLAFDNSLSLNQLVIQCLKYAIDNLDENDSEKWYLTGEHKSSRYFFVNNPLKLLQNES